MLCYSPRRKLIVEDKKDLILRSIKKCISITLGSVMAGFNCIFISAQDWVCTTITKYYEVYTIQRLVNLMVHCIGTIPTISLTLSIIQTDKWKSAGLVNPYWLVNKADQRLNRCKGPVTQAIFHKTNFDETNDSIWNSRIMLKAWWIADILCEMRKTVEASQMSNFITKEDRTVKFTYEVLNCFTLW